MTALSGVASWLRCPVCHDRLEISRQSLVCPSHHNFDVARQGYANLLGRCAPANADTPDMLASRDRFLAGGHYQPITEAVASAIPKARKLLEIGAGTGHHLASILDALPSAQGLATDVSVAACRRAAKAHPRMASVVADTWVDLPLRDASVEAVLCIFAPRNFAEIARILTAGGKLVIVVPGPEHLGALRRAHDLINIGEDKLERLALAAEGLFSVTQEERVEYDLDLSAEQATDLVAMGPNAFHSAAAIPATTVHVSVSCLTFTPCPSSPTSPHGFLDRR